MFSNRDKTKDPVIKKADSPVVPAVVESIKPNVTKVTEGKSNTSIIAHGVVIKGDISGTDNIVIYGSIEGSINLNNNSVSVEEGSKINADINCKTIKVNGRVAGNINASEKILVTSKGHIVGDINSSKVELQDGSFFKGNISMNTSEKNASNNTSSKVDFNKNSKHNYKNS